MSKKTIARMVEWVEMNISDNPTLHEMSSHVGYSPYYCSSKFHEVVGLTFKRYVLKRKLSIAALELGQSDRRIIDIAVDYGFSSHEAFTRSFVKEYGITPLDYRRKLPSIEHFERLNVDALH